MDTIETLMEQLSALSTTQIGELKGRLETLWGVSGSIEVSAPAQMKPVEAPVAEPTEFNVLLTAFTNKMGVIRVVREATALPLLEARNLVDGALPAIIKTGVDKTQAETIKAKIEENGGSAEIKPV